MDPPPRGYPARERSWAWPLGRRWTTGLRWTALLCGPGRLRRRAGAISPRGRPGAARAVVPGRLIARRRRRLLLQLGVVLRPLRRIVDAHLGRGNFVE